MSVKDISCDSNQPTAALTLIQMMSGYRVTQAVYVAACLGIPDLLKDGPKSISDLATSVGAHTRALHHVMIALARMGIFSEQEDGRFDTTPLAEALQTGVPDSVRSTAILWGEEMHWRPWGELLHTVRTGNSAFQHVFGMGPYEYLDQNTKINSIHSEAMAGGANHFAPEILAAYDFSGIGKIIDLGGGQGALVASILKANPRMGAVVFDRPSIVDYALRHLEAEGVANRCEIIGGSLFGTIPEGGDRYILCRTIHVFDDDAAVIVLKNCRRSMTKEARLLVIDGVMSSAKEPPPQTLGDVNLLLMGGIERTQPEFGDLLAAGGFRMTNVTPMACGFSVIEAVPV